MAKNQELYNALAAVAYTGDAANDEVTITRLRRLFDPVLRNNHQFRDRVAAEADNLGVPRPIGPELNAAGPNVGRPTVQYLLDDGGGNGAINIANLILLAKTRVAKLEISIAIDAEANSVALAQFIAGGDNRGVLRAAVRRLSANAADLSDADLSDNDVDEIILTIQNKIVKLKKAEIDAVTLAGIGALDAWAPAVADITDAGLKGALDAVNDACVNLTDAQAQDIRRYIKTKIAALRTEDKLAQIGLVVVANIAADLGILQPDFNPPASADDDNALKLHLGVGYEHLQAPDLERIRTAARRRIAELRTLEKIDAINLLGLAHQAELNALSITVDDEQLKVLLGGTFAYLSPDELQRIRDAAAAKIIAIGNISPTVKAQQQAAHLIAEARTALARADAKLGEARRKLVLVNHQYVAVCAPLLPGAHPALAGNALSQARVTRTEVTAAFNLAKESVEKAVELNDSAVAASVKAEKAFTDVNVPGASEADVTAAATLLEQQKDIIQTADRNMAEVDTNIDRYSVAAQNPRDPNHKLKRANVLIERFGQLGYEDTVADQGVNPDPNPNAADHGVLQQAGAGGVIASYHGIQLTKGQAIHSVRLMSTGVSRLVQDPSGKVATKTQNIIDATPDEQAREAIKQAKMLLTNYDPNKGAIYIKNFVPRTQAKRVFAALLLEIENSPHLNIQPADIIIRVDNWKVEHGGNAFGWRTKDMFIDKYIGSDLRKSALIQEEIADVTEQTQQFRAALNEARAVVDARQGEEIAVGYKAPGRNQPN